MQIIQLGNIKIEVEQKDIKTLLKLRSEIDAEFEKKYSRSGHLINHTIYKQSTVMEVVEYHPEVIEQN